MENPRYNHSMESSRRANVSPLMPFKHDSAGGDGPPSPSKLRDSDWTFPPWLRALGAVLLVLGVAILVAVVAFSVHVAQVSSANAAAEAAAKAASECETALVQDLVAGEVEYKLNLQQREWRISELRARKAVRITDTFVKKYLLIPTYPCAREVRLGMWGDGGKWVCISVTQGAVGPITLSIGHQRNKGASFEQEIARRLFGFSFTFDYAFRRKKQQKMLRLPYLNFYNYGVAGSAQVQNYTDMYKQWYPDTQFLTLPQAMVMVNITSADILKLDCGGCEYGIVEDLSANFDRDTVPVNQVLMELNGVSTTPLAAYQLILSMESLGFRLFHTEIDPGRYENFEVAFVHDRIVTPSSEMQTLV